MEIFGALFMESFGTLFIKANLGIVLFSNLNHFKNVFSNVRGVKHCFCILFYSFCLSKEVMVD